MSFFGKMKNALGIGGVKIQLDMPGNVSKEEGVVKGKVVITTKSEQPLKLFKVKLVEIVKTKRSDDSVRRDEYTLGSFDLMLDRMIKPEETQEVEFEFPFAVKDYALDNIAEKGGVMGAMGKLGKMASNERREYVVEAFLDVEKVALDPTDSKEVALTA